jgi:protein TonB
VQVLVAGTEVFHQVFDVTVAHPGERMERPMAPIIFPGLSPRNVQRIEVACPIILTPRIPKKALIDGISGKVTARIKIADGRVREVQIVSPPSIFDDSVVSAISQYDCSPVQQEVIAVQEFDFKVTD